MPECEFSYLVPVVVCVRNGHVESVTVCDETSITNPKFEGGDQRYFKQAVKAAEEATEWPSWELGF